MILRGIREFFKKGDSGQAVFKEKWIAFLDAGIPMYKKLPEDLKLRLHERIARFVESTRFEGCNGLELTEEMVLAVAGQACMLVLNREGEPFPDLRVVYLYPTTFSSVQKQVDASGIVSEGEVHRLGESWSSGSVVLAWDSVEHGARNMADAHNVTLHEFAHQLDHEDGDTDGAPPLPGREAYRSWARVFGVNYADFLKKLESGKRTLIDPYGAVKPAEFFAVATETFFEKPRQLLRKRPELYETLREFYGVDPAEWLR